MTRYTDELKIKPAELKNGLKIDRIVESYGLKGVEQEASSVKLRIEFHAEVVSEEVLVSGNAKGEAVLECYSCNEKFILPVEFRINQSFPSNVEVIGLEEEIRQLFILNLPDRPLCKDDCKGLCPQCGRNLNTGKCGCRQQPSLNKWGKLEELLKKKQN